MALISTATKSGVLCDLRMGVLQPSRAQISDRLRNKGIPSFEIEKLTEEILDAYEKERPRY